jgi:hypothetical protein
MSAPQAIIKLLNKRTEKMMTRKDYVATANILNGYKDTIDFLLLNEIALDFAEMFTEDNERFDEQRFIDAVFEEKD